MLFVVDLSVIHSSTCTGDRVYLFNVAFHERKLKSDALDAAETGERIRIQENWIFDDFCEEDYM